MTSESQGKYSQTNIYAEINGAERCIVFQFNSTHHVFVMCNVGESQSTRRKKTKTKQEQGECSQAWTDN